MLLVDTHAHLDMSHFDSDREAVIARAAEAGVSLINTIGIDVPSSEKAIELAQNYPGIVASIGFHPADAQKATRSDIEQLANLAANPLVVAIGEMGLDFYHDSSNPAVQLEVLNQELDLARKVSLPIIIHCREAHAAILPVLRNWSQSLPPGGQNSIGVIHCFSGNLETAKAYLDIGFYLALGGYISYPSSALLREVIREIPNDRLVLETDCPFLPPQKFRGKRNEPAYIPLTLEVLSKIKGISPEEMAAQTTHNAIDLFNLKRLLKLSDYLHL